MPNHRLARYLMKETGIGLPLGVHLRDPLVLVPTVNSTKRMQLVLTQVQPNCFRRSGDLHSNPGQPLCQLLERVVHGGFFASVVSVFQRQAPTQRQRIP
jgi:hypothetical protein